MYTTTDLALVSAAPRAALAFVFVTVMLDMLALGIIAPVFPKLVLGFVGNDTARASNIYGILRDRVALMQFVFSPLLGALSDRFGRKPVIVLSNLGTGLDYIVMALAPNLAWLFAGRLISGGTTASVATAGAYIADIVPPEKRAGAFGLLGAAFGAGFAFGPAIGGLLRAGDPRLPFWVAAGFSLANAAFGFFVLAESLPREKRGAFSWRRANHVRQPACRRRADQHVRALHNVSLRLGCARRRFVARICRNLFGRHGTAHAPDHRAHRRAPRAFHRPLLRRCQHGVLRARRDRPAVLARHADLGVLGAFRRRITGVHDTPGRAVGTGSAPRRDREHPRPGDAVQAGTLHVGLRGIDRDVARMADSGRGVAAGGSAARMLYRPRRNRHPPPSR